MKSLENRIVYLFATIFKFVALSSKNVNVSFVCSFLKFVRHNKYVHFWYNLWLVWLLLCCAWVEFIRFSVRFPHCGDKLKENLIQITLIPLQYEHLNVIWRTLLTTVCLIWTWYKTLQQWTTASVHWHLKLRI